MAMREGRDEGRQLPSLTISLIMQGRIPPSRVRGQGSQATAKTAVIMESQPLYIERRPGFPCPLLGNNSLVTWASIT